MRRVLAFTLGLVVGATYLLPALGYILTHRNRPYDPTHL